METLFMAEEILPRVGLELRSTRSVGQRLTHLATGAPVKDKNSLLFSP